MFDKPSYLIQVGHHGKNRVDEAINRNHLDGAVLSPSDYKKDKTKKIAQRLNSRDLVTLFDPHFYLPGQGDRKDLNDYDYHEQFGGADYYSGIFYDSENLEEFSKLLIELQDDLNTGAYISPAPYLSSISEDEVDDWHDLTKGFIKHAKAEGRDIPLFLSLPISGDQLNDDEQRAHLLDSATEFDVHGFYVSVEYGDRDIRLPLKGEQNVKSYLDLMLNLRVNRYEVISAHTHQIAHLLFAIGVDAVASGHYKNLRAFDSERWIVPDETQIRRTVIRYYSDELLDTIRPDSLLNELHEKDSFDLDSVRTKSPYEDDLFDSSLTPANAGWGQANGSWDHYTWSCYKISEQYRNKDLSERVKHARKKIRKARALYKKIDDSVDEYIDELDSEIYDDWETVLESVVDVHEFKRLQRST